MDQHKSLGLDERIREIALQRSFGLPSSSMVLMERIDIFIQFIREALCEVDNCYYGLNWWNDSMLNHHQVPENAPERQVLQDYLDRYGERVFCYELYHQLRKKMENHSQHNPNTFQNILLESELKKEFIGKIVEDYYNITALDAEYFPDFLLHTPNNFDNQDIIVEVKSNPKLGFSGMKEDLIKIQQFISKYGYSRGVFLSVNTNPERIGRGLMEPQNIDWLRQNIQTPNIISIFCKKKNDVDLLETTIQELFDKTITNISFT
jgi:hypothetical protein